MVVGIGTGSTTRFFIEGGKHFARGLLGRFFRGDADRTARLQIHKSRCYFAPIAEFQGALAKPAISHDRHSIGDAAVDLDVSH